MRNCKSLLAAFSCLAFILFSASLAPASPPMDAKLETFFKRYLEASFSLQPMSATQLGDHRFDRLLDDVSPDARARWIALDRATLEALPKEIAYADLSRAGQVDFEILQQHLKRSIWVAEELRHFENDPRVYNEYISDSVFLLLAQSSLPAETNIANSIARMKQIPRVIEAAKLSLKNPPRDILMTAVRQNDGAIAFYEKDVFELAGKSPQLPALKSAASPVVECLKAYRTFLTNDLLPRATGDWRIGKDKFYRKLELTLDAGVNADQVLADAQAEFDRVSREMYVIARQLWSGYFPKQVIPPDDAEGRRTTIARVLERIARDHSKPSQLLTDARKSVGKIKRFIRENQILDLPEPDQCRIIEMPEFQRGNSTAYMNSPPPLDKQAVGFYAVSPPPRDWSPERVRSFFEEYNRSMLQILTIHEAYPGHYVQNEYANRNPSSIRKILSSGVYVEGWAVYTEQTLLDQGYGEGDLALRLTQLKFYLRAVCNAILDHKMHCSNLTDDQAMDLLTKGAFQSEGEARLKVIRSKQSSVQLSTYFVGRMGHYRLRQDVQRELGEKFQLNRYHHAVLAEAAVPIKFLPELVRSRLCQPR